jgi:hypothetical protein
MKKIEQKIKEIYKSKKAFAKKLRVGPNNVNSKIETIENKINTVNEFLEIIDLKLKIKKIKP